MQRQGPLRVSSGGSAPRPGLSTLRVPASNRPVGLPRTPSTGSAPPSPLNQTSSGPPSDRVSGRSTPQSPTVARPVSPIKTSDLTPADNPQLSRSQSTPSATPKPTGVGFFPPPATPSFSADGVTVVCRMRPLTDESIAGSSVLASTHAYGVRTGDGGAQVRNTPTVIIEL
jgi:hypothetical protein